MVTRFTHPSVKALSLPIALAAITIFSGCATTTMKPDTRSAYDNTQQTLKAQSVNIISDGCLIRVEGGKNDIMYQRSDLASQALAQTVKTRLTEKGVKINKVSSPFVCGSLTKDELTKMDILVTHDAKDQLNTTYPLLSSTNDFDSAVNQAYLNLHSAIRRTNKVSAGEPSAYKDLGLDITSLNTIRKVEGTNKVFLVTASGSQPSMGTRMATGALTVAVAFAGGSTGYIAQKGQYYSIYLINLETNQVEWVKAGEIKANLFKMPVDSSYTVPKMFAPLYAE